MARETEERSQSYLSALLPIAFLPICGAVMYANGRAYRQGYLDGWGFDESLMDLSIQETLYRGFLGQISILLLGLGALALTVALLIVIAIFTKWSKHKLVRRPSRIPQQHLSRQRETFGFVEPLVEIVALVISAHLAVALVWEPVRSRGIELATKQGQCALEGGPCNGLPPTATVRLHDSSGVIRDIRARVVTCNMDRCGLRTIDGNLVVPKSAIVSSQVAHLVAVHADVQR